MTKNELQKIVDKLPDGEVCFAIWSAERSRTVDLLPSGCIPTGQDGVTRIGLSDLNFMQSI